MTAASGASTPARPAPRAPSRTSAPPPDSRAATSSGRRRCRTGTATGLDSPQTLLEQRDRADRAPGAVRIGLGEEDRAEPVGDVELRIERRRDVEQRIEQVVRLAAAALRSSLRAARSTERRESSRRRPAARRIESASRFSAVAGSQVQLAASPSGGAGIPAARAGTLQRDGAPPGRAAAATERCRRVECTAMRSFESRAARR